ncbi:hypothetical protein V8E36_005406 [Tilletia maclaganii]
MVLPHIFDAPPELEELYTGQDALSLHFKAASRSYNNAFAFVSIGGTRQDLSVAGQPGVYTYRIQAQIYHKVGPAEPGQSYSRDLPTLAPDGDTIGTLPYTHALAAHLAQRSTDQDEWELVIPTPSSTLLIDHLRAEPVPPTHIVIQVHSTGCQDLLQLLSSSTLEPKIAAAIFQAPFSDSEDFHHRVVPLAKRRNAAIQHAVGLHALATQMVAQGRGNELLPRSHVGILNSQSSSSSETKVTPGDPIIHAPIGLPLPQPPRSQPEKTTTTSSAQPSLIPQTSPGPGRGLP